MLAEGRLLGAINSRTCLAEALAPLTTPAKKGGEEVAPKEVKEGAIDTRTRAKDIQGKAELSSNDHPQVLSLACRPFVGCQEVRVAA